MINNVLVIAFIGSSGEVIPYDHISHIDTNQCFMIDHKEPVVVDIKDREALVQGFIDWLKIKQSAIGIDVENER